MKGTIYGNKLPMGTQVKRGWEPLNYMVWQLYQQHAAEVEHIITSPVHEPIEWVKAELVQGCPHHENSAWDNSFRMRKWATVNHRSSSGTWHKTCRMVTFAPFGPLVYCRTFKPYSPGRLDSALHLADRGGEVTQPTTSSTSPSVPDNTAGLLERVEDLSEWRHIPAAAHIPHTHTHTLVNKLGIVL
jgi:hypothetical protein